MPMFLLRVEGVNLASVIDDTDDLSTRRGGGLMVLNAARQLRETLPKAIRERLTLIAQGASIGLFQFEAGDDDEAEQIAGAVREHLSTGTLEYKEGNATRHLPLKHGTFVVDVAAVGDRPAAAVQRATARNRWRQMRGPTVALDGLWVDEPLGCCAYDFARPAVVTIHQAEGKKATVSRSVAERRDYGRLARQTFYQDEAGAPKDLPFTDDLKSLSGGAGLDEEGKTHAPSNTHDKIAVFYVDGNQFGKRGREFLETGGTHKFKEWSRALEDHHKALLRQLIERVQNQPGWWNRQKRCIRLETLLWGGDEILWVVPAWKGWELVEWFFGQDHMVSIDGEDVSLSYGCGLVFCHVKAPIQNIIRLARDLGDAAKDVGREHNQHRLAYEVMESFDDVTGDLGEHRARFLPRGVPVSELVFDPARGPEFWNALRDIARAEDFPMRQLYRLNALWRDGEAGAETRSCEARLRASEAGRAVEGFLRQLGDRPVAWLHLLQMLPYLPTAPEATR
jgi:hypothetical protein